MRHHDAIVLLLGENGRNLDFTVWPTCFLLLGRHLLSFFSAVFLSSCLPDTLFSAATASCCGHNRLLAHPYYSSIAFGKNECNSQWSSPTLNYFDLIMTSDGFKKKKSCVSHLIHNPPSPQGIFIFPLHHLEGSTTIGNSVVSVGISSWKLGDLTLNLHISCFWIFMYFLTFAEFPTPRFCPKVESRSIRLCAVV